MVFIQSCYGRQTHVGAGLKQRSPINRKTATLEKKNAGLMVYRRIQIKDMVFIIACY